MSWLRTQWDDIKGNVKYALATAIGASIVSGALLLTEGLPIWKQAALLGLFSATVGWGIYARRTPGSRRDRTSGLEYKSYAFTMSLGALKKIDTRDMLSDVISLTLLNVGEGPRDHILPLRAGHTEPYAEVRAELAGGFFLTGYEAREVAHHTFHLFKPDGQVDAAMLYTAWIGQEPLFRFVCVHVTHVNLHAKTAEFVVTIVTGNVSEPVQITS